MSVGKEIKGVAKHSMIYGIGNILQRIPPFLLLPLYLNYLDASDFGINEMIGIMVELSGIVISLGITNAMGRFYYEYEDEKDRNEVVSTIFITFGVLGAVSISALLTQRSLLAGSLLDSPGLSHYILIAFVAMWFNAMYGVGCNYLRVREKSKLFVTVTTLKLILALSLNVYFVAFLKLKVLGILLSTLVCSIAFFFILSVPILFKIGARFSTQKCREMLKFSLPFIITNLAAFTVHASDRLFLKHFLGLHATGIYALGYRMGSSVNSFVTSPFIQIWLPRRFAIHKQPHAKETYARVMTYYLAAASFLGVWLSLVSKDVLLVIGKPDYYDAAGIIPLIILSYIIFGLHYHVEIGIMITKKTGYLAYINSGNAALNIALNLLLIPKFGMYGAAYATVICFINKVGWTRWISNRLYPLKFEYGRIGKIVFAATATFLAGWLIPYPAAFSHYMSDFANNSTALRILGIEFMLIRSCAMLLFVGLLLLSGFLLPEEKDYAQGFLSTAKARLATLTQLG